MEMGYADPGTIYNRVKSQREAFNFERFPDFTDLSSYIGEELGEDRLPRLDRKAIDESKLTSDQKHWRQEGYVVFKNAVPDPLIDDYLDLRRRCGLGRQAFPSLAPYDSFEEIKALCLHEPLLARLNAMLGYKVALHFNLSAFTSTERGWHQDDYMSAPDVAASGVAIWFALGDIHPDAGPFEFIPGSHRWPIMRREKVARYLSDEAYKNPDGKYEFWAQLAEYYVNPACEAYIRERGARPETFLGKKGDVLVWHGGLMHRGSFPRNGDLERPALISHYCDPKRHPVHLGKLAKRSKNGRFITFPTESKLEISGAEIIAGPKPLPSRREVFGDRVRAALQAPVRALSAAMERSRPK